MTTSLLARWEKLAHTPTETLFTFAPGTRADYETLAHHHYRAGPPATIAAIISARHAGRLAGVLVVSMPVLNGPWRSAAWPGRFSQTHPRDRAHAVNAGIRTISRLIVHPDFRAMGLGASLVCAYLNPPLTPCTEAIASMARFSGVFAAAGMRAVPMPPSRRDSRLRAILAAAGIAPELLLGALQLAPTIEAALRTWANDSRATRRLARGPLEPIALAAAHSFLARPLVFASESPSLREGLGWAPHTQYQP